MKEKITQTLTTTFFILASVGMLFAQQQSSQAFSTFSKLFKPKNDQHSQKVASHDDLPSSKLVFDWSGSNWDTLRKHTYTYNTNGTMSSSNQELFNGSSFDPYTRSTITYDANGNEIENLQDLWTGTAWENAIRETREYDVQGNESEYIIESKSSGTWLMVVGHRYARQYNSANQIVEEISEFYDSGTSTWLKDEKANYQFASGVWTEVAYSSWSGSAWEQSGRITDFVWHDFAKELATAAKFQRYENGMYVDKDRFTCTYSQFDSYECIFESYTTSWANSHKEVVDRDRLDHEVYRENYYWSGTWDFDSGFRSNYVYDAQERTVEVVFQEHLTPANAVNEVKFVFSSFFTSAASGIQANVDLTAFPNPVNDQLNFDLKLDKNGPVVVTLFDVQGRKRLESSSTYNGSIISIPISSQLENGTYFYQLKSGDAFAKGKVVVSK